MKKLILILIGAAFALSLTAQNSARYRYDFYGGLTVGGTYKTVQNATIDSITVSNDTVYFWSGATRLLIAGTGGADADSAVFATRFYVGETFIAIWVIT